MFTGGRKQGDREHPADLLAMRLGWTACLVLTVLAVGHVRGVEEPLDVAFDGPPGWRMVDRFAGELNAYCFSGCQPSRE